MSDEDESCQVQLSGIPEHLNPEDIELFFESERYCPDGGDVKNTYYSSSDVIVVTFCERSVADRLVGKCLTMPGEIKLYVEPYKRSKSQGVVLDGSDVNTSREQRDVESGDPDNSLIVFSKIIEEREEEHPAKTSSPGRADLSRCSSKSSINSSSSRDSEKSNTSVKNIDRLNDCSETLSRSASSSSSEMKTGIDVAIASESVSWTKSTGDRLNMSFHNNTNYTSFDNKTNRDRSHGSALERSNTFSAKRGHTQVYGRNNRFSDMMNRSISDARIQGLVRERDSDLLIHGRGNSTLKHSKQLWKSQDLVTEEDWDGIVDLKDDSDHKEDRMYCPADALFPSGDEDDSFTQTASYATEVKTKKLSFGVEKVKLLQLVFQSKGRKNTDGCHITFDEKSHTITLNGMADDLTTMELNLRETALQFVSGHLDIPKASQKLLLSKRGEDWLAREFSQRRLLAVFYVSDGKAYIVAFDDTTLQSALDLLDKILTSQKLSFDDSIKSFLQSGTWASKIQDSESSGLVSIDTDYSQKLILITGSAADVSSCTAEVRKILNTNTSTTRSIKHKVGVVRLLETQSHEMTADINAAIGASVRLEFDAHHSSIKVVGLLDDVEKAVKLIEANYLKVVCYDKYEVNIQGLTLEMFKNKTSLGSEMIDLLERRNKCVIEVRGNSASAAEPQRPPRAAESVATKPAKRRSHRIQLLQGSIVEFKADVLVNSVAHAHLERAGIVNTCFLKAGGGRLVQELRRAVPQDFGNDVTITSAGGQLDAKLIFHAAIRRYRNQESLDRLYNLIKKCLEMADKQHGVKSIAFPTLGCGKLGYNPSDVAECFSRAVKKTGSDLQIYIISFEDHLLRDFKSSFSHESTAGSSDTETTGESWLGRNMKRIFSRQRSIPTNNRIVFHINAMSDDVIRDVRDNLSKRINEMVTEAPIKDEAIADLSDEIISRIEALASSSTVDVRIDRKKSTITVKGEKSLVNEAKMKILHLVYKEGSTHERHRGSPSQSTIRYPKHWSFYKSLKQPAGKMDHKRTELTPGGGVFDEVSRLVMKTWEQQKVGHGNDAAGLGPHTIKIRRIFCIENPSLYRTYMSRREEFCLGASINKCHRVKGLQKEGEIMTLKLGLRQLDAALAGEVNECYLLHGTKSDMVTSIESTGLDSRLSGPNVLFGPGTYFTESSTKADQYADAKNQRVPNGQPLYIYVCRVLLGNTFICSTPKPFKRAPCMQAGCYNDICSSNHAYVGNFDSVIGTHKGPGVRLIFREFVIYHPDQSYPEFLVEYQRQ